MMALLNWVDYILLAVICLFTLSGLVRGMMREVFAIITFIAAAVVAALYTTKFADYLITLPSIKNLIDGSSSAVGTSTEQAATYLLIAASFTSLFVGISIVGGLLSWLINAVFGSSSIGFGSRFLGGILGFIKGVAISLVIVFIIQLTPFAAEGWWKASEMVKRYEPFVTKLGDLVSPKLKNMTATLNDTAKKVSDKVKEVSDKVSEATKQMSDSTDEADRSSDEEVSE